MRREDFSAEAPGQLIVAPQGHLAFVPDPLLGLRDQYRMRALQESRSGNLLALIDFLFERPVLSIADVMAYLSLTRRAAAQLVQRLIDQQVLSEITGRRRNRAFAAREIIRVIGDG